MNAYRTASAFEKIVQLRFAIDEGEPRSIRKVAVYELVGRMKCTEKRFMQR